MIQSRYLLFIITFSLMNLTVIGQIDNSVFTKEKFNEEDFFDKLRVSLYSDSNYNATGDFHFLMQNGIKNIQIGEFNQALGNFKSANFIYLNKNLKKDSSITRMPSPLFYIGVAHEFLNHQDSSIYYLKKCINSNRSVIEAYNELGRIYFSQNKSDTALYYLNRAYKIDKKSPLTNYSLGYIYFLNQQFEKALHYLEFVTKVAPRYIPPYVILGHINMRKDNTVSKAIKFYTQVIDIDSSSTLGYYYRSISYLKSNKSELAYHDFLKLYKLDTLNYSALAAIGILEIKRNQIDLGLQRLVKAMSSKTDTLYQVQPEDIRDSEFKSIILELYKNNLTAEERNIGFEFLKNSVNDNWQINKTITNNFLNEHGYSKFVTRLYLLSYTKTEGSIDLVTCYRYIKNDSTLLMVQYIKSKTLLDQNSFKLSINNFTKIINQSKEYPNAYYYRGLAYLKNGSYEQALHDFDKVLSLYPNHALAYNDRGNCYQDMLKYDLAKKDFLKSISIIPSFKYPYNNISMVFKSLNKLDSAIIYASKAIELDSNYFQAYYNRSFAYKEKKDYVNALLDCNRSIKLYPNWTYSLILRKDIYLETSNFNGAIYDLTTLINMNLFQIDEYIMQRAQAYYSVSDFNKAILDLSYLNKQDTANSYISVSLGNCYKELKDFDNAIKWYDNVLKKDSTVSTAYYLKGLCYSEQNKTNEAIHNLSKAIQIDSTFSSPYEALAFEYYKKEDFDSCISLSKKALQLNKNLINAMYNIALAELRKNNFILAKRYYQVYSKLDFKVYKKYNPKAISNLKELVFKGILAKESQEILKEVFNIANLEN